jgi:uncharacterized protein (DUF608 family)
LPHFHHATCKARFPFASIQLTDEELPIGVEITGWSPFIPTDDDNSSLPVAAIEYKMANKGASTLDAIFSFNTKNFVAVDDGKNSINKTANGFILSEAGTKEKPFLKTDFAVFTDDGNT